jgi:hypothetical protein
MGFTIGDNMNKQALKARTLEILVQIHRGFLTDVQSGELTDADVLQHIPANGTSWEQLNEDDRRIRLKPFTERWVRKQLKRNPNLTAYDMLVKAGFQPQ